jgi:glyoxylase I family protein
MAIQRSHHIALKSQHYEESKRFYTDIMGFKIVGTLGGGRIVFIDIGGTTIELMGADPVEATEPAIGFTHLAFQVDDVDATYAELKAKGVQFHIEPRGDEVRVAFFRDPDGNLLELFKSPSLTWQ